MASDFGPQLKEEARPFLESGEEILASIVAQPRGTSNSKAGGLAPQAIGGAWAGKSRKTAEKAGDSQLVTAARQTASAQILHRPRS